MPDINEDKEIQERPDMVRNKSGNMDDYPLIFQINGKKDSKSIRLLISNIFNVSLFPEEIYFLSELPSEIDPFAISIIGLFSIVVTCLVSIYPAMKASKLDTIESLKYE